MASFLPFMVNGASTWTLTQLLSNALRDFFFPNTSQKMRGGKHRGGKHDRKKKSQET